VGTKKVFLRHHAVNSSRFDLESLLADIGAVLAKEVLRKMLQSRCGSA